MMKIILVSLISSKLYTCISIYVLSFCKEIKRSCLVYKGLLMMKIILVSLISSKLYTCISIYVLSFCKEIKRRERSSHASMCYC